MADSLAALATNDPELSAVFINADRTQDYRGKSLFLHHALYAICNDSNLNSPDEQVRGLATGMWDGLTTDTREFWIDRARVARLVRDREEFLLTDGSTLLSKHHSDRALEALRNWKTSMGWVNEDPVIEEVEALDLKRVPDERDDRSLDPRSVDGAREAAADVKESDVAFDAQTDLLGELIVSSDRQTSSGKIVVGAGSSSSALSNPSTSFSTDLYSSGSDRSKSKTPVNKGEIGSNYDDLCTLVDGAKQSNSSSQTSSTTQEVMEVLATDLISAAAEATQSFTSRMTPFELPLHVSASPNKAPFADTESGLDIPSINSAASVVLSPSLPVGLADDFENASAETTKAVEDELALFDSDDDLEPKSSKDEQAQPIEKAQAIERPQSVGHQQNLEEAQQAENSQSTEQDHKVNIMPLFAESTNFSWADEMDEESEREAAEMAKVLAELSHSAATTSQSNATVWETPKAPDISQKKDTSNTREDKAADQRRTEQPLTYAQRLASKPAGHKTSTKAPHVDKINTKRSHSPAPVRNDIAKPATKQIMTAAKEQSTLASSMSQQAEINTRASGTDEDEGRKLFLKHALDIICEDMEIYHPDDWAIQTAFSMWEDLPRATKKSWGDDARGVRGVSRLDSALVFNSRRGSIEKETQFRIEIIKILGERNDGEIKYLQAEYERIKKEERRIRRANKAKMLRDAAKHIEKPTLRPTGPRR